MTAIGLAAVAVALLSGGRARWVQGVLEAHGGLAAWVLRRLRASAMTLGHVVIAIDGFAHDISRAHERVHVRQCERWGPLFIPAYLVASMWAWWCGRGAYEGNVFEVEAYRS